MEIYGRVSGSIFDLEDPNDAVLAYSDLFVLVDHNNHCDDNGDDDNDEDWNHIRTGTTLYE